jgi:hypothetical protein
VDKSISIDGSQAKPVRVIPRPRLAFWLEDNADFPVRLVIAPAGFGKTTVLLEHLASRSRCTYVRLDESTTLSSLRAHLRREVGFGFEEGAGALDAAPGRPIEIIFDDVQRANDQVLAYINRLISEPPTGVSLIVAAQYRDLFEVGALFAHGLVALCDQSELAFDADEISSLCQAYGVEASRETIETVVERCDGWPLALAGAVREALATESSIEVGLAAWYRRSALPATDLVNELLARVTPGQREDTQRYLTEGQPLDQSTLASLHRSGFFVRRNDGMFAMMHCLDGVYPARHANATPNVGLPVLNVRMFGRFEARINGVPIVWVRRRDQQIIKYLLLLPQSSASRSEVAKIFWPDTRLSVAMQSLRTACSTIRRAIANVVGADHVDEYLIIDERLTLNRAMIVCDIDRFQRHIMAGDAADEAGAVNDAVAHYRAAERLYGIGLLAGDVRGPLFERAARTVADDYMKKTARLSVLLRGQGLVSLADTYAAKAENVRAGSGSPSIGMQKDLRFAAS